MAELPYKGGCIELVRDAKLGNVHCCRSCHDDWDFSDLMADEHEVEFEGGYYWPCCGVLEAFSMNQQEPGWPE